MITTINQMAIQKEIIKYIMTKRYVIGCTFFHYYSI